MPFDLSIKIVGTIPAQFVPQGGGPSTALQAKENDTVSWGNTTRAMHQPWPTKQNGELLTDAEVTGTNASNFLSDAIPKQQSSSGWVVKKSTITGNTIFYCCKRHKGEFGTIVISD